jgi:DNA-directed RNA polymerase subunit RPC12/RpoP
MVDRPNTTGIRRRNDTTPPPEHPALKRDHKDIDFDIQTPYDQDSLASESDDNIYVSEDGWSPDDADDDTGPAGTYDKKTPPTTAPQQPRVRAPGPRFCMSAVLYKSRKKIVATPRQKTTPRLPPSTTNRRFGFHGWVKSSPPVNAGHSRPILRRNAKNDSVQSKAVRLCKKPISKPKPRKKRISMIYTCFECEKKFTSGYALDRHKHTHTGNKPYKCNQCDKAFNQEANLNVHITSVHNKTKYQCHICFKLISSLTNLNHHISKTHGVKPKIHCSLCDTYMRGDLARHQANKICKKKQKRNEDDGMGSMSKTT